MVNNTICLDFSGAIHSASEWNFDGRCFGALRWGSLATSGAQVGVLHVVFVIAVCVCVCVCVGGGGCVVFDCAFGFCVRVRVPVRAVSNIS